MSEGNPRAETNPIRHHQGAPPPTRALLIHDMAVYENFERCTRRLFERLKDAQRQFPGLPRHLLFTVQGHRGAAGEFDDDALEVMQEFIPTVLREYLTQVATPLYASLPQPQRDDIPDELRIWYPPGQEGAWYDVERLPLRVRETISTDRRTRPTARAIASYLGLDEPTCLICWGSPAECAHVVPAALGGSLDVRNFALLCPAHHRQAPDIADAEAFWAWVDYAEIRDSGSKWISATNDMKAWVRAIGERTEPKDRSGQRFATAVSFELRHLYGWSDVDFATVSWDLIDEYQQVLDAATSKHFGIEKKVSTCAWAYHIAMRRLAKRLGGVPVRPDHPWTGTWPVP